jgi:hypothetical protein
MIYWMRIEASLRGRLVWIGKDAAMEEILNPSEQMHRKEDIPRKTGQRTKGGLQKRSKMKGVPRRGRRNQTGPYNGSDIQSAIDNRYKRRKSAESRVDVVRTCLVGSCLSIAKSEKGVEAVLYRQASQLVPTTAISDGER